MNWFRVGLLKVIMQSICSFCILKALGTDDKNSFELLKDSKYV